MAKSISPRTSAETAEPDITPGRRVVVSDAPAVPMFYANNTGVETSVWDVCLKFGETIETDRKQNITKVRELAWVRLSPQHARVVVRILMQQLENYERHFGAIPAAQQPAPSATGAEGEES